MRDGAPMAELTANTGGTDPGPEGAAAALAAVFAVSPLAQAIFDDAGRCIAASAEFSCRAAAAADAGGRLSVEFLDTADVRGVLIAGRAYQLVTLPVQGAAPPARQEPDRVEPMLRLLLDAIPAAINVKDREGRYLYMNPQHAAVLGVDAAASIGRTHAEIGGGQSAKNAELERRVLETGKPVPFFDENHTGADGVVRDWLITKTPLRAGRNGETVGVATFALDISDRKRLEAALVETKKAAEGASQAKTLFLAQVSHELRTPLNAIIGFTEIMTQEIFGPLGAPQYHGYAGDVLKAARHLLSIITDMLDVTRLDAGALALELAPVALGEIVAEAARMVAPAAAAKRIALRQYVEPGMPALNADARRLRQAVINLIANAVKFTPEGGTVAFGALRTNAGMELYVEDSGIGMSPDEIATALLVFGRVREGYAKAQEGTGIGLPLAKALIEAHGGTFTIDSARGRGTKIRALFPAQSIVSEASA